MERRQFFGTSLALGAAGSSLLTACSNRAGPAAAVTPRPAGTPIRLSSNENPLGLSPAARQAILADLGDANRYPKGAARQQLTAALASKHGVQPEQIQLGTGSTEILQMCVQHTPAEAVMVIAEPTFEDVARYATASRRRVVAVPVDGRGSHDITRMHEACNGSPALVFVCNPNNPTGTLTSCDAVDQMIRAADDRVTFVIDEAYFEFADDPGYRSAVPWIRSRPNVIVVRTFSKIYGMAGLRLGYAIAQPATIERLRLMACSNNVNELALAAGVAALTDTAFQQRTLDTNRTSRAILTRTLDELGLAHLPSHTNFVMHRIAGPVADYNRRMLEAGFVVGRPFPPMLDHSRVSLGLPDEMELFTATLRDFRARGWV